MGLIFLRHAYSRFLTVKAEIEPSLRRRRRRPRALTKEDFSRKGAIVLHPEISPAGIVLHPEAQFDHLGSLPDSADREQAISMPWSRSRRTTRPWAAPWSRPSTRSLTTTCSASLCAPLAPGPCDARTAAAARPACGSGGLFVQSALHRTHAPRPDRAGRRSSPWRRTRRRSALPT